MCFACDKPLHIPAPRTPPPLIHTWAARLGYQLGLDIGKYMCGATLIRTDVAVTAAHVSRVGAGEGASRVQRPSLSSGGATRGRCSGGGSATPPQPSRPIINPTGTFPPPQTTAVQTHPQKGQGLGRCAAASDGQPQGWVTMRYGSAIPPPPGYSHARSTPALAPTRAHRLHGPGPSHIPYPQVRGRTSTCPPPTAPRLA